VVTEESLPLFGPASPIQVDEFYLSPEASPASLLGEFTNFLLIASKSEKLIILEANLKILSVFLPRFFKLLKSCGTWSMCYS
jgi:hypothetical protein